ncbi:MAG TPA: site-specific integrase [Candidatus Limosilactobacillus excrementigallinarum]|nr:site-specific integrase [Candidatus Limosilactobacillus excrementigallinarum]
MWVEKRKDNRYKFVEQYRDPLTDKKKRVSITYDKNTSHTRKEAQLVLEQRIQDKLKHVQDGHIKKGITFRQVINEWQPIYKARVRMSTYKINSSRINVILRLIDGDTLISKINSRYLASIIEKELYQNNKSTQYVKMLLATIRSILKYAYTKEYISSIPNPNDLITWKPISHKSDITQKFLDDDEVKKVLSYIAKSNQTQADMLDWQYLSGMRFGEVAALKVKDIDYKDGVYTVYVHRTLVYVGVGIKDYKIQNITKTEAGMRHIVMPKKANYMIKQYIKGKNSDDLLFSIKGHPVSMGTINAHLKYAKQKLGIHKTLSTHTFRHTHVSKLAELGVPLYVISKRVGHSNSDITKRVYLHVTKHAQDKFDKRIENF